ncbi:hypothetical protein DH2020_029476 [Rehmannia glutinosa]|uniref:Erythronate-4-phosphate dehydrogenase family protein n=1 Tax=Rehmannia glutinosa TaxID=99300 RepID=A0ABR0VND9_REHGL
MDVNEEEVLISLRDMRDSDSDEELHENGVLENGHAIIRHATYPPSTTKVSLQWLDLRVFYVRVSKCVINDDSTPEDRLDRRSEEVTFVSTDCIRMTGSVKFEVFHKDMLVLSGTLELCHSNGFIGESNHQGQSWSMNCESDVLAGTGFLKGNQNQYTGLDSASPAIEVYVAGSFLSSPIILTKALQLSYRKKQTRKGMLESIPEYEATQSREDDSSALTLPSRHYTEYKQQEEGHRSPYFGMEYLEGEDGELSWFNAGVRVGVGIGLSICLGVGIGVGLIVRTYQGTTRNFRRRLL